MAGSGPMDDNLTRGGEPMDLDGMKDESAKAQPGATMGEAARTDAGAIFAGGDFSPEESTYLTRSEVVLLKIVNMKENSKDLEMLQTDLKNSSYSSIISKDNRLFKKDPRLEEHARMMRKISNDLMKIKPDNIGNLKQKVSESGILEMTRDLKISEPAR